ncbi:hypothetical protein D1007_07252 [Hordeum vulgare]|nr:hypothetical protein D1007_07252 [Hordeum vulgare]
MPHTWLRLPDFFVEEIEDLATVGLWIQPYRCDNGPSWVATEFNSLAFLFLRRGCKSFAFAQGLLNGHILHLKFDGAATLFVKVFGGARKCLGCCMEDSSGGNRDSSGSDDNGNSPFSDGDWGGSDSDNSLGARMKEEVDSD